MSFQELLGEVADHARRVVSAQDHLDYSIDRQLDQLEQLPRRSVLRGSRDLVDNRAGVVRPLPGFAIAQVPSSPQRIQL